MSDKVEDQEDDLYMCNVKEPTDHCKNHCFCGMKPHRPQKCTKIEFCDIVGEKVKCVKVSQKQLKELGMI